MLNTLLEQGFKAASQPEQKTVQQLYRKHFMTYDLKHPTAVLRDTERYGIDHRTLFNLTPLMVATRIGNPKLVNELMERGANPDLYGNNGLNALQMALEVALFDDKYAKNKLPELYSKLEPDFLSIQVEGRLIKLDKRLMQFFMLNLMFALFYRLLGEKMSRQEGFTAKEITAWVQQLPDSVLPERRKKQQYISSILSSNEVEKPSPYNRQLFKRIKRGHYIINPVLKLRHGDEWLSVHDRLNVHDLGFTPWLLTLSPEQRVHYRKMGFKRRFDEYQTEALEYDQKEIDAIQTESRKVTQTLEVNTQTTKETV